jgi:hypothetical protein
MQTTSPSWLFPLDNPLPAHTPNRPDILVVRGLRRGDPLPILSLLSAPPSHLSLHYYEGTFTTSLDIEAVLLAKETHYRPLINHLRSIGWQVTLTILPFSVLDYHFNHTIQVLTSELLIPTSSIPSLLRTLSRSTCTYLSQLIHSRSRIMAAAAAASIVEAASVLQSPPTPPPPGPVVPTHSTPTVPPTLVNNNPPVHNHRTRSASAAGLTSTNPPSSAARHSLSSSPSTAAAAAAASIVEAASVLQSPPTAPSPVPVVPAHSTPHTIPPMPTEPSPPPTAGGNSPGSAKHTLSSPSSFADNQPTVPLQGRVSSSQRKKRARSPPPPSPGSAKQTLSSSSSFADNQPTVPPQGRVSSSQRKKCARSPPPPSHKQLQISSHPPKIPRSLTRSASQAGLKPPPPTRTRLTVPPIIVNNNPPTHNHRTRSASAAGLTSTNPPSSAARHSLSSSPSHPLGPPPRSGIG